jgi:hypothetical protein
MNPTLRLRLDPDVCDPCCLKIIVEMGSAPPQILWFRSNGLSLARRGDALLCLGLSPSLELAAPLALSSPISHGTKTNEPKLRTLLRNWYPGLADPPLISPPPVAANTLGKRKTALFYSAGVDSSHSLATSHSEIDYLITLIGADVPVEDRARAERLCQSAREVAETFHKESIIIETNVRKVFERWIGWSEYHGAVLAAVGHMLSDHIDHVMIASSADEASWLRPWGSHPDLDPLYGNESLRIEHHQLVPRFTKVLGIIHESILMRNLRVCDYDDDNCGKCPDCSFMRYALTVLNAFDRAPTYSHVDWSNSRLRISGYGFRSGYVDLRSYASSNPKHQHLVRKIDRSVRSFNRRMWFLRIAGMQHLFHHIKRFKRRIRYQRATKKVDI